MAHASPLPGTICGLPRGALRWVALTQVVLRAPAKAAPRVWLTSCVRRRGQAQKRFRERQKTKFTELTSKVEQLEARLASALVEKARSEDRASILEKCLELRGNLPVAASSGAAIGEVRAVQHVVQKHALPARWCPPRARAC